MKRNVRMAIVALAFMAAGSTSALAQSADNNQTQDSSITYRPFQISFVPMLGTNGIESPKVANRLSVNIIAGMSKGVGAAEYGGIANLTNGKVFGFQYAGILNTSKDVTGCQVAGIVNLTRGNVKGFQAAGVVNNTKDVKGFQAAGVVNLARGTVEGSQAAGVGNMAKSVTGVQMAGVFNLSADKAKTQLAGVFNSATTVEGVQISGIVNRAKTVGTQIGIVNIADSCSGATIGFINIVKSGYHQFEVSGDELFYANLAYRSGVKKLHTIFSAGIRPDYTNTTIWTTNFGVGTSCNLSAKTLFDAELSCGNVVVDDKFRDENNRLYRAYIGIDKYLFRGMSIAIGATANLLSYNTDNERNEYLMKQIVPYTMYTHKVNDSRSLSGWIGGKIALRFN
ncbi:hypothetical protein [uncultured Acetobacteroides sp.]|uniref:hypothetical protein n=1 Tax=uncultured Acetobacteroides sp. TaxID=1760811 RepID=UPI0029F5B10B|nr:hypothetical protein [uncultured Acetobacteroides sp.]